MRPPFRSSLVTALVTCTLAGCTAAPTSPSADGAVPQAAAASEVSATQVDARTPQTSLPATRVPVRTAIAALSAPDRGELFAYGAPHAPQRSGAFTSHPVTVSELHAIRAAHPGGTLALRTPSGRPLVLRYDRHVEHPDGNWTWFGRQADGSDAVITFGEKAIFGSIQRHGEPPLRLTMARGVPQVVETDPRLLAPGGDGETGKSDARLPGSAVPVGIAAADGGMGAQAQAAGDHLTQLATSARTVDVLLGYTSGFAAQWGGASPAITRLNYLVDVTNAAYVNSGVDAQVRLVATLQVAYADATSNDSALHALTGYDSDTQRSIPVDPALAPLREARERQGADLVSLVRAYRRPQNAGCGVAWLVGGDQSAINASSAGFGYSVVSDGSQQDGDLTYYCYDETLAHELGHNMGQAHNSEDSTDADGALSYGAHAYSFGWREASPGCFITVMAYREPDSCQGMIRYFSNPNVAYFGRPTGVADVADNARSLNLTVPLIAAFRASTVAPPPAPPSIRDLPPRSRDMDANGRGDLTWYKRDARSVASWFMGGNSITRHGAQATGPGYRVLATADFNRDGRLDMLWAGDTGDLQLWFSNGTGFDWRPFTDATGLSGPGAVRYPQGWTLQAAMDLNGDGKSDLVWANDTTGQLVVWSMDGSSIVNHSNLSLDLGATLLAAGDYNGDGWQDLLTLQRDGRLSVQRLLADGVSFTMSLFDLSSVTGPIRLSYPAMWSLVASADVDADGDADLVWYNPSTQRVAVWKLQAGNVVEHLDVGTGFGYRVLTTGDFDGDRRIDLVWQGASGDLQFWFSTGSGFTWRPFLDATGLSGNPTVNAPTGWTLAGAQR